MTSLREHILAADDIERQEVHVPEWNCTIWVRSCTIGDTIAWETLDKPMKLMLMTVIACSCDEEGNALFTYKDAPVLEMKSVAAITRIFQVASKLNKLDDEEVEDIQADFLDTPASDSSSD